LDLEMDCYSSSVYSIGGGREPDNSGRCKICNKWVSAQNRPRIIQGLGIGAVFEDAFYCREHLPEESEAFAKLFPFGRNFEKLPAEEMPGDSDEGIGWINVVHSDVLAWKDKIQDALDAVNDRLVEEGVADYSVWTKEIKQALVNIGKEKGLSCYASDVDGVSSGEWLYDLCWISYCDDTNIGCIELAAESEWSFSPKEIHDDFVKLIQARAGLRLMIWQAKDLEEMKEILDVLIGQVRSFEDTQYGDAYLFSCWIEEKQRFTHKVYEYGGC